MTLMTVPIIDISPYWSGVAARKQSVAQQINEACRDIGFLLIAGHRVSEDLIQAVEQVSREFFDLPLEDKMRVVRPALARQGGEKQLVTLLLVASAAIALFYGAGLTWGHHTHLTIVEYWRWWVVHLWVEGFFEVFATTVIAFFFMRLGLVRPGIAAAAALMSATIFLSGGIIGTCHHLYFSGTPTVALAPPTEIVTFFCAESISTLKGDFIACPSAPAGPVSFDSTRPSLTRIWYCWPPMCLSPGRGFVE